MITLAILYYLASKIGGEVDKQWFYEALPVDPETGKVSGSGVFAMTQQAPKEQGGPDHTFITLYVLAGEDLEDDDGNAIPEKQATDQLADAIQQVVTDALNDPQSWTLTVPTTGETFRQVRITPYTGKNTMPLTPDGAVVKSLDIEVYYERDSKKVD